MTNVTKLKFSFNLKHNKLTKQNTHKHNSIATAALSQDGLKKQKGKS